MRVSYGLARPVVLDKVACVRVMLVAGDTLQEFVVSANEARSLADSLDRSADGADEAARFDGQWTALGGGEEAAGE